MAEAKKIKAYEIGELDHYLFGQGNHYEIYKKLGSHKVKDGDTEGVYFAVWAPNAKAVSVIGEFNNWDETANEMERGSRLEFIPVLFRMCRKMQCISILLKRIAEPGFLKQIHLQIMRRCVRERHQG